MYQAEQSLRPETVDLGPDLPYALLWIDTEDWHTAGEPFRIVEYLPAGHLPQGVTIAERRFNVLDTPLHPLDTLRQTLCHEPRGHADMYGGFIVPSNDSGAHFGVLFWHKDGFSTACGHGTIALGYWAVAKGLVEVPQKDCEIDVVVDAPSGRVKASVAVQDGKSVHADFVNVAGRNLTDIIQLAVPSYRIDAHLQLSYGGAVYVSVNATQFELSVEPSNAGKFIQLARSIKDMLLKDERKLYGQGDIYGVMFWQDEGEDWTHNGEVIIKEKNIVVFADGQIDRSPCGSGMSARVAIHHANGRMRPSHGTLLSKSIIGTSFEGRIAESEDPSACISIIRGRAGLVGRMKFFIDPQDPIYPGFLLR